MRDLIELGKLPEIEDMERLPDDMQAILLENLWDLYDTEDLTTFNNIGKLK